MQLNTTHNSSYIQIFFWKILNYDGRGAVSFFLENMGKKTFFWEISQDLMYARIERQLGLFDLDEWQKQCP